MKTAYGNAPMKFIRLEAEAHVMNWTTGFKRNVNCWPKRNIPLAPANGRQQPATEATPAPSRETEPPDHERCLVTIGQSTSHSLLATDNILKKERQDSPTTTVTEPKSKR